MRQGGETWAISLKDNDAFNFQMFNQEFFEPWVSLNLNRPETTSPPPCFSGEKFGKAAREAENFVAATHPVRNPNFRWALIPSLVPVPPAATSVWRSQARWSGLPFNVADCTYIFSAELLCVRMVKVLPE